MKALRVFAASSAMLPFLTACSMRCPDLHAERQAVAASDQAWSRAALGRDVEKSVSFVAEDAIMFPPGEAPVVGKTAIRTYISSSFQIPGFSVEWDTDRVEVAAGADLAYAFGRSRYHVPGPDGAIRTIHAKGVSIWRKDADGQWRCIADIWNEAPSLLPPIGPAGGTAKP
jgi:uncharacterized protein (TIGR02246 family)